jgi:hypothetical protein
MGTERKKLCKRRGFNIVSVSEMNSNKTVSMQTVAYFKWATTLAINTLPSLTLQSDRDLNVPCRPKRSKALLLSYTFQCPLKKRSLSAHALRL